MKHTQSEKTKVIECSFWIVNSLEERRQIEKDRGYKWPNIGLTYPHIIGNENGYRVQTEGTKPPKDYYDEDTDTLLKYIQKLTPVQ